MSAILSWLRFGTPPHYVYIVGAVVLLVEYALPRVQRPEARSLLELLLNGLRLIPGAGTFVSRFGSPVKAPLTAEPSRIADVVKPAIVILALSTLSGCGESRYVLPTAVADPAIVLGALVVARFARARWAWCSGAALIVFAGAAHALPPVMDVAALPPVPGVDERAVPPMRAVLGPTRWYALQAPDVTLLPSSEAIAEASAAASAPSPSASSQSPHLTRAQQVQLAAQSAAAGVEAARNAPVSFGFWATPGGQVMSYILDGCAVVATTAGAVAGVWAAAR